MTQIEVDDSTAEAIRNAAEVRNLSVAEYVRLRLLVVEPDVATARISPDYFDVQLDELLIHAPTLPNDFSRVDINNDHD
ncbi:MAG: hypothetical protein ABI557_14990 [Aureliella sp.]